MINNRVCRTNINGTECWSISVYYHREDGPAVEYPDGSKEWWLNDKKLSPEIAINNQKLQSKYPKLIEVITIYLVHNS